MNEFAKLLRTKFAAGLQVRPIWGRAEVQRLLDMCIAEISFSSSEQTGEYTCLHRLDALAAAPIRAMCCGR